jgi:hypothetical protein
MRAILEELSPFSGELNKGKRLSLTLPPNTVYRTFYLETNIPVEHIEAVELANGSDLPMGASASELIMMENHNKRAVIAGWIPFHVADIKAKTLPGQDSLERPSHANDSHEFRVRLASSLPAPAEGEDAYFIVAHAAFTANIQIARDAQGLPVIGANGTEFTKRVRTVERRFERHTINNVSKGIIVFDKLMRGPKLRTLYIKGDISKIEVICRKGGNIIRHLEIEKELNDYIQKAEYDLAPQDGYFIFNPVGTGFMSDSMNTSYDTLTFKLHHEADNKTIDILADVVLTLG